MINLRSVYNILLYSHRTQIQKIWLIFIFIFVSNKVYKFFNSTVLKKLDKAFESPAKFIWSHSGNIWELYYYSV